MVDKIFVLLLTALAQQPITVSGNFPRDLLGSTDTRLAGITCDVGPCVWGMAGSATLPIAFHPPLGYRVQILSLRGDLTAWIKTLPGDSATPVESMSGVLAGFQTQDSGATKYCDYCAIGCPLYVQGAVGEKQPSVRLPFDYDHVDQLLGTDNTITAKVASWLNTTGKPIHLELTYTIKFIFEKVVSP